jgi:transcription initiation factor IIE alpha subunit
MVLVENLVSTVARAFYTDTVVIVLEGLMHEKYIIEEELGPRLKLSAKEVRKITTQLESEMLICVENVTIGDTKSFLKCYYIDYQQFVDAVRFRVHLMQRELVSEEKSELHEVYYECPTCKTRYNSLEVQRLICADFKFICNSCCPVTNFRAAKSEAYYRLVEVDNTGKLSALQLLERKLEEQMNKSKLHDGIFDLLGQLRDVPLGHNLPSLNISKGVRSSQITDERVAQEIKQNFEYATGQFGSSLIKKKNQDVLTNGIPAANKTEFKINIESEDNPGWNDDPSMMYLNKVGSEGAGKLHATQEELNLSLPHFLRDSRVTGAQEMLLSVKSLQAHSASTRAGEADADAVGDGDEEQAHKRARLSAVESKESEVKTEPTEETEDVAWEDGDGEDDVDWEDAPEEGDEEGGES